MPRLVDLTHPLAAGQTSFPGDPPLVIDALDCGVAEGWNLSHLAMGSHQGTHLDAPFHYYRDGTTVDRLPLGRCYGPARVIDLAPGGMLAPRSVLGIEAFQRHAEVFAPAARVVFRTGWDRKFGEREFFSDYPRMTAEAARWIAARRIGLLGMDTPTPGDDAEACHAALLAPGVEIVLVESLANLHLLPERFTLAVFPLALVGRDGSPVRAVGVVDDD